MTVQKNISTGLESAAKRLLRNVGIEGSFTLAAIPGGRNNRVFRLETENNTFLFKAYFHSPHDLRDRLRHEYLFLEYLQAEGSRYAARPIAADFENRVALLEFIGGESIALDRVDEELVNHAIRFFEDLNRGKYGERARALPDASEACFSISQHCETTRRRIDRLKAIQCDVEPEAFAFVHDELIPAWNTVCRQIEREEAREGYVLSQAERCISPSDFGFHNALLQPDGTVRFVDFEYAGWDDPAKLIIDFANQPDLTLDRRLSTVFTEAIVEFHGNDQRLCDRVKLLEPLYQIKWSCICLNDFLPAGKSRRNFTGGEPVRLERARKMLCRAEGTFADILK
jgi:hypothetical protein